jgi:hypothetical protein
MATPEIGGASPPRNPDRIPTSIVFGEPPGIDGTLTVSSEHGDVVIHAELIGRPFCALVLALDDALTLNLWIAAHVIDERRRRRG